MECGSTTNMWSHTRRKILLSTPAAELQPTSASTTGQKAKSHQSTLTSYAPRPCSVSLLENKTLRSVGVTCCLIIYSICQISFRQCELMLTMCIVGTTTLHHSLDVLMLSSCSERLVEGIRILWLSGLFADRLCSSIK